MIRFNIENGEVKDAKDILKVAPYLLKVRGYFYISKLLYAS
jgi:hypothetical protein